MRRHPHSPFRSLLFCCKTAQKFSGWACLLILLAIATGSASGSDNDGRDISSKPAPTKEQQDYHTPLAGEQFSTASFGRDIDIPSRNRDNNASLVLGSTLFTTSLAGRDALPIGAVYMRHRWDDLRLRTILGVFVNEADISKTMGNLQLLGHIDNNTVPFPDKEIADGQEVRRTSIIWGTVNGRAGIGMRLPVSPFQIDNDLRVQLFGQAGYLYTSRTSDTGQEVRLPPDTPVFGTLLRVRYDGLRRNLMELPHSGFAGGLDAELMRRNRWSDANYGGALYPREETRDYLKVSGYLLAAGGVPRLSEKNRLLFSFYGGFTPQGHLDRFSAFRIGGGPIPTETDDLYRQVYPGAMFNQFPAMDYLIGSAEYRRELLFFLHLHLRYTYAWVKRAIFTDATSNFLEKQGKVFSAAITSGFFWNSQLFIEYSYDTSILRNGSPGSSLLLLWSKEL